jgi:hypothetical protein
MNNILYKKTIDIWEVRIMKKRSNGFLKKGITICAVALFLLTTVSANASIQEADSVTQPLIKTYARFPAPIDNRSLLSNFSSALIYVVPLLIAKITGVPYRLVRNWNDKPFPHPTLMFFGSYISIRPKIGVTYYVLSFSSTPPEKVEMFSDNSSYATLNGISIPPSQPIVTLYPFYYTEKGFHHLKFVPDGNESAAVYLDIQVGFKGFTKNILPYLF